MEIKSINNQNFGTRRACHPPKSDKEMFRKFRNLVAKQNGGQCPETLIGHISLEEGRNATMYITSSSVRVEPRELYKSALAIFRSKFSEYCTKGKLNHTHPKTHKRK